MERESSFKLGIWSQMKFETSCYYSKNGDIEDRKLALHQSVYLFHSKDSRHRKTELDTFYNVYVPEIHLEKKFKLLLTNETIRCYDIMRLARLYKTCENLLFQTRKETLNSESTKLLGKRNRKKKQGEIVMSQLLPMFESIPAFDKITGSLPVYECKNLSNILSSKEVVGGYTLSWLRLMSWWKIVNDHLYITKLCVYQRMGAASERFDYEAELAESVDILENLLGNLGLSHGVAELSAIQLYAQFNRCIQNNSSWIPAHNHGTLLYNIAEDSKLIAFMLASGYQSIDVIFDVLRGLDERTETDMIKAMESIFRQFVNFYNNVILSLQITAKYRDFIPPTVQKMDESFKQLFKDMRKIRRRGETRSNLMQIATSIVIKEMCKLGGIITENQHIKTFFGDTNSRQIAQFLLKFLNEVTQNAMPLVYRVSQGDFVTSDMLLEICRNESEIPSTYMFDINCIKVAYCILGAYKFMNRGSPSTDFNLAVDYKWSDFRNFLDEILVSSNQRIITVKSIFQEANARIKTFQNELCFELRKELEDIAALAKHSNEILQNAKHI